MTHDVIIQDGTSREPVAAVVVEGISDQDAEEVDSAWQRALITLLARVVDENPDEFEVPEHSHWDWRKKMAEMRAGSTPSEFFALECKNEKQGMMAVTVGLPSGIPEQMGALLVYVEYISTAPWNLVDLRSKLNERPRYRAVGPSLLTVAVEYSQRQGFSGRIGLHALPQAEDFYRDACWMTDLGQDAHHDGLQYFEFTEEQAQAFLREE